jgi:hypothetical protein
MSYFVNDFYPSKVNQNIMKIVSNVTFDVFFSLIYDFMGLGKKNTSAPTSSLICPRIFHDCASRKEYEHFFCKDGSNA